MNANPQQANPDWPPVVVASAFQTGMLLMRNLERRGVQACCVDCKLTNPGFRSVYGKSYACPDPDQNPEEWLRFMVDLAASIGRKPVLIAASDQFVSAMARHAAILEQHFTFFASSIQLQADLCTKRSLYEIAGRLSFPLPLTRFVTGAEDLAAFAGAANYPCIMKPQQARMWTTLPSHHPFFSAKLVRAVSKEDLVGKYAAISQHTPDVVVQEEIAGPDTAKLVYLSCYARTGERLGYVVLRERRTENPIHFGSASMVEPVRDPETETLCDNFLRKLNYRGICEIEVKRDSRDGRVKMIEANPRYSGTADAAPYDGVDIGWLHYLDLIQQPVQPVYPLVRDFRHVMFINDLGSMRHYVAQGLETWGSIAKSYRPPVYFYDMDPRDWRNFAKLCVSLFKVIGVTIRSLIFGEKRRRA